MFLVGCGGGEPASEKQASKAVKPTKVTVTAQANAGGEPFGDITIRFVYDGDPPTPPKLTLDRDQDTCGKNHPVDESLLVGANGGIEDVIVWMYLKSGEKPPAPHESYAASATAKVTVTNRDCRFEPHVTLLRTGQPLVIANEDPIGHNTQCKPISNPTFNVNGTGEVAPMTKREPTPVDIICSSHGWMKGVLVIQDHPYFAKSDEDGKLIIKNIPAGTWSFRIFHKRLGFASGLDISGATTSRRGTFDIEIESGTYDLGEVNIPASRFD